MIASRVSVLWAAVLALCGGLAGFAALQAKAQSPEQLIDTGARVHGGFGTYIALGIRIGNDALETLKAQPREVDVTLYSGPKAPCPCLVDGVMVVTAASPGQGTLRVAAEPAAEDQIGVVVVKHRKDGRSVRYVVPASAGPKLFAWNKEKDPRGRLDAVMAEPAENLYVREGPK
jgi:formylmethanofuran dehydrogenase subunit E